MSFALHERRRDLVVGGTLSARVYDVLKDRILARELPPGARLKHAEIAEALGVSMTPVREAMLELERDGLVETIPYRGSVVKEMSPKEVRDVYNVRIALEALAAQLAAGRIADEALSQLEQLVRDYEIAFEKRDMPCGLRADLAIHELVIQEADNPILQETVQKLANRIQMFRQMDWVTGGEPLHGHRALLAALGRHDGHEAARLVAEHIERGKTHTLRILESPSLSQASDAEGMC
jgi:DNA-binding GntR family transcriptional regulator